MYTPLTHHTGASISIPSHNYRLLPRLSLLESLETSPLLLGSSVLARILSICGRVELELLLLRLRLVSLGSPGCRPLARAKALRTSVKLTTPDNHPDIAAPGSWPAETALMPGLTLVPGYADMGPGIASLPEPDLLGVIGVIGV